ncbi:MAG: transcription antitermination factor NusB [Candidatus Latescibacterota bacterium]|nr:transcription antitermination factor NusB [Candidatus Latescibacterota bacterium]
MGEEGDDFFGDGSSADDAPPDNRSGARQIALQALYSQISNSNNTRDQVQILSLQYDSSETVENFANMIVDHVDNHINDLDALIEETSIQWSPERIARIDRIILRIGIVELLYLENVPARVAIYEAVELARAYSTDKSYAFINGILDTIAKRKKIDLTSRD